MAEDGSEQFAARGGPDSVAEDNPDYAEDDLAEIDREEWRFPLDDPAVIQDQGDAGTADPPREPEEVS